MISLDLHYERQAKAFTCGAAALVMVYRSFGFPDTEDEVWDRISRQKPAARTSALAADALTHGLAALTIQATPAWGPLLEGALAKSCRLILNHRPTMIAANGHFSVVTAIGPKDVWLHDPLTGPSQRWTRTELDWCWQPTGRTHRIGGRTLVVIGERVDSREPCAVCGATLPGTTRCLECSRTYSLTPSVALGCTTKGCPGRRWAYVFCPYCDHALTF